MIFFNAFSEQRKGAQCVLLSLGNIPAIQNALMQIERDVPLEQVSQQLRNSLEHWIQEQRKKGDALENELRHERMDLDGYKNLFEELKKNPLQCQLEAEREAHASTSQRVQDYQSALSQIQEALKREQDERANEVHQLRAELAELNRLVAKQHIKLQELTGIDLNNSPT